MSVKRTTKSNNGWKGKIQNFLVGNKKVEIASVSLIRDDTILKIKESYQILYESMLELYPPDMESIKRVIAFFRDLSINYYTGNHEKFIDSLIDELLFAGISNFVKNEDKRRYLTTELAKLKLHLSTVNTPHKPIIDDQGGIKSILMKPDDVPDESEDYQEE